MKPTVTPQDVGEVLARRRWEQRLSLREVQAATGVDAATLSRLERGSKPALDTIAKLADWLGIVVRTGGQMDPAVATDDDLKRVIENHLRKNKNVSRADARSIANHLAFAMRIEVERAAAKTKP